MKTPLRSVASLFLSVAFFNSNAQWQMVTSNADHIISLAASGPDLFAGSQAGYMYHSSDNGLNWMIDTNGLSGDSLRAIAISGDNIYAGTRNGVFLSTDYGNNWIAKSSGLTGGCRALAVMGNNVYSGGDDGVYFSSDSGSNWSLINNGFPQPYLMVYSLAVCGNRVFVGTGDGIYMRTDTSTSWQVSIWYGPVWNQISVEGANIYAVGNGVLHSPDSGNTWYDATFSYTDNYSVTLEGNNVFVGGANGVYVSTNAGNSWTIQNGGFMFAASSALLIHGSEVFAGVQDGIYKGNLLQLTNAYDFSIAPNNGCSPLTLTITNQTTDPDAYLYEWLFIGPLSEDTLHFWDTLTTTFSKTFYFNTDTPAGAFLDEMQISMAVYNSSGTFLDAQGHTVPLKFLNINFSSVPDTCFAGVGEATATIVGTGPYDFTWSTGYATTSSVSSSISDLFAGSYGLTVSDATGCTASATVIIENAAFSPSEICIVTVDSATNKNKIIWERQTENPKLTAYNIYKQSNTGTYNLIGSSPDSALTTYIDNSSNPAQIAARYKISSVDSCSNETALSAPHKTIHLTIGLGIPPAINLTWDSYEGINYNYFVIWRGNALGNLVAIDTVQSTLFSYSDQNPPFGTNFYAIQIIHPNGCDPTLKSNSTVNSSFSNIVANGYVAIENTGIDEMQIFPNPTNGKFTISGIEATKFEVNVIDILGNEINVPSDKFEIDLSAQSSGVYFLMIKTDGELIHRKILKE